MPVVPSVALNPTTIMIAERIAKAVYSQEQRGSIEAPEPSAPTTVRGDAQ
jgi:hypothetical protein